MPKNFSTILVSLIIVIIVLLVAYFAIFQQKPSLKMQFAEKATKLYWFIPDGMRADENLLTVYKWAIDKHIHLMYT